MNFTTAVIQWEDMCKNNGNKTDHKGFTCSCFECHGLEN